MSICGWIILGGLAGWIASMLTGRKDQQGCIMNIIVGIVGAAIGGAIIGFLGGGSVIGFNLGSLLVAVLGAVVLLAVVNMITRRK
ncbi:MAG TPA: GlsB/YeaQ/YmgE family stress response membrane protein [candidate division Zixibacteria bacterium]|nr:GlsB/YeaQ/YmgE family stress response membrane protein [candidate division Zixibacteria bacterium]